LSYTIEVSGRLVVGEVEKQKLLDTIAAYAKAWRYVAEQAVEHKTTSQGRLHHLAYKHIREEYGLPAHLAKSVLADASHSLRGVEFAKASDLADTPMAARRVITYNTASHSVQVVSANSLRISLSTVHERVKGIGMTIDAQLPSLFIQSKPASFGILAYNQEKDEFRMTLGLRVTR